MRTRSRSVAVWTLVVVVVAAAVVALTRLAASVITTAGASCGSTWHVRSSQSGVFGGERSAAQVARDGQACLVASNGHWHTFVIFFVVAVVAVLVAVLVGVAGRRRMSTSGAA